MSNSLSTASYTSLAAGFAEYSASSPNAPALYICDELFTYGELLEKTECVFAQLCRESVPAFVGIYTEESVWTYAAILAVSLSGACYVPLNPKLPAARLQVMMGECHLQLILTENPLPFGHEIGELVIDKQFVKRQPCSTIIEQDLAYLMFTSGTTGQPKGVPVSKKNTAAFFRHYHKRFDFNAADRFLQPYELSFDVSVFSVFAAWNVGAAVYCVPEEGIKYLKIADTLQKHEITVSSLVPSVLLYLEKYLPELSFPQLRYSFFSGDKLYHRSAALWKKAAPRSAIYNCYGPAETTIVCTDYKWEESRSALESLNDIVPLGQPFEGMDYLLLSENGVTITKGVGELCFAGDQVITAYLNDYFEDRFLTSRNKRYYKTGDLAEVNTNNDLIFHGRRDAQVKINGYRIELTEVEAVLRKLTGVEVIVISLEEERISVLVAVIESQNIEAEQLKAGLSEIMPGYMVPSRYLAVPLLPRNINGKIDRQMLMDKIWTKR